MRRVHLPLLSPRPTSLWKLERIPNLNTMSQHPSCRSLWPCLQQPVLPTYHPLAPYGKQASLYLSILATRIRSCSETFRNCTGIFRFSNCHQKTIESKWLPQNCWVSFPTFGEAGLQTTQGVPHLAMKRLNGQYLSIGIDRCWGGPQSHPIALTPWVKQVQKIKWWTRGHLFLEQIIYRKAT